MLKIPTNEEIRKEFGILWNTPHSDSIDFRNFIISRRTADFKAIIEMIEGEKHTMMNISDMPHPKYSKMNKKDIERVMIHNRALDTLKEKLSEYIR